MSYGHAPLLADGKSDPVAELDTAVRRLGAWARLNPPLRPLHGDFEACLERIRELVLRQPEVPGAGNAGGGKAPAGDTP